LYLARAEVVGLKKRLDEKDTLMREQADDHLRLGNELDAEKARSEALAKELEELKSRSDGDIAGAWLMSEDGEAWQTEFGADVNDMAIRHMKEKLAKKFPDADLGFLDEESDMSDPEAPEAVILPEKGGSSEGPSGEGAAEED
jgi:hypothetical protein